MPWPAPSSTANVANCGNVTVKARKNQLDALGVVVNMIVVVEHHLYAGGPRPASRRMATRCVQKTRRDCHRSATSTSTCWDATRSPYLNRSLGASSGRSETPLTAVANRTFRSIAPQTPQSGAERLAARRPEGKMGAHQRHLPARNQLALRRPGAVLRSQRQDVLTLRPAGNNARPPKAAFRRAAAVRRLRDAMAARREDAQRTPAADDHRPGRGQPARDRRGRRSGADNRRGCRQQRRLSNQRKPH